MISFSYVLLLVVALAQAEHPGLLTTTSRATQHVNVGKIVDSSGLAKAHDSVSGTPIIGIDRMVLPREDALLSSSKIFSQNMSIFKKMMKKIHGKFFLFIYIHYFTFVSHSRLVLHDVISNTTLSNLKFLTQSFCSTFLYTLCTLTGKSTDGINSTSVCIVGESSRAATDAGRNEITSECFSETFANLTANLRAGRARAHTKQEQGIAETEVLCRETVTGMENSLKNEHYPVVLTEQRDRIEEEVRGFIIL